MDNELPSLYIENRAFMTAQSHLQDIYSTGWARTSCIFCSLHKQHNSDLNDLQLHRKLAGREFLQLGKADICLLCFLGTVFASRKGKQGWSTQSILECFSSNPRKCMLILRGFTGVFTNQPLAKETDYSKAFTGFGTTS